MTSADQTQHPVASQGPGVGHDGRQIGKTGQAHPTECSPGWMTVRTDPVDTPTSSIALTHGDLVGEQTRMRRTDNPVRTAVSAPMDGLIQRVEAAETTSWQEYLQHVAHEVRGVAHDNPASFPLVISRHPAAPWLQPPLRDMEMVEHLLATLCRRGFTDDQAVDTYKAFTSFLASSLLLEVPTCVEHLGDVEEHLNEGGELPERDTSGALSRSLHVQRMRNRLSQDHSAAEFETGLETLLNRIENSVKH